MYRKSGLLQLLISILLSKVLHLIVALVHIIDFVSTVYMVYGYIKLETSDIGSIGLYNGKPK